MDAAAVTLFDPDGIAETNSFENPKCYPVGIPHVIVNGAVVIDGGEHTGARREGPSRSWLPTGGAGERRHVLRGVSDVATGRKLLEGLRPAAGLQVASVIVIWSDQM